MNISLPMGGGAKERLSSENVRRKRKTKSCASSKHTILCLLPRTYLYSFIMHSLIQLDFRNNVFSVLFYLFLVFWHSLFGPLHSIAHHRFHFRPHHVFGTNATLTAYGLVVLFHVYIQIQRKFPTNKSNCRRRRMYIYENGI